MNLDKLERDLGEAADNLCANSKLTAAQYAMPVLGLIYLRHAYNHLLAVKVRLLSERVLGLLMRPVGELRLH